MIKLGRALAALLMVLLLAACTPRVRQSQLIEIDSDLAFTAAADTVVLQLTEMAAVTAVVSPTASGALLAATTTPEPPTATSVPLLPSETPTPEPPPAEAPPELPGAEDPRDSLGEADWQATFADNSSWYLFDDGLASFQIREGQLAMIAKQISLFETWSLTWPKLEDFYLEVTALSGQACRDKDRYGIIVRAPHPHAGYLFGISCDGAFRLAEWDGRNYQVHMDWTPSPYILAGPLQTNRLGFWAEGERLVVYVNGYQLAEIQDDTLRQGTFGTFIAAAQTEPLRVTITAAAYWILP